MKPGMAVPARGRSSAVSSKARDDYAVKLTAEGPNSPKALTVMGKMEARALHQGAPQPGMFGGVPPRTRGAPNRRPPGYKPSKTYDEESKVYMGLVGTSGANIRRTTDVWGDDSGDESDEESGPNNKNPTKDSEEGSVPTAAGNLLELAFNAALAQRAALAAQAVLLAGEGVPIDGVMVEVGVGAGAVPKPSEGGSSSSGGWGSGTGSARSSMGGLLEFTALLEVVGQRANHFTTHTVPKKARRLTAAMLGFGTDLSESADALAGRLRANSSKVASKVESGWEKVVVKADKAGSKTKAFFGKLKSLVVCGSSNLPKM